MRSFTVRTLLAATVALTLAACGSTVGGETVGGTVVVPPAEGPRPATPQMGINLEFVLDYARSEVFADCMKSARTFGSADAPWDEKAAVDKDGWPTGDAGTVVMADLPVPVGGYSFSCTGRCIVGVSSPHATVQGQGYDRATNRTVATINVAAGATNLYVSFKGTQGGVKNIRLYRPGYRAAQEATFTKEFLAAIAPFQALRLMDFTRTNTNDAVEWADRTKPTDALQSGKRGVAWEYGIELANKSKKDLWINVPVKASDDYVRQLAKLLKEKLDPDRVVYVEYSNEVWNSIFPQFGANLEAAKAEVARQGDASPLSDHGQDRNEYYWAWKRVAQRLVAIAAIFKEVWGDDAINTRIRPVLASQAANVFMLRMQTEFIEKNVGPPHKFIYGVAGAPYLGLSEKFSNNDRLTVDQIFSEGIPDQMKWVREVMGNYQLVARYYRLHNMCYEGGMGIEGEHAVDAKVAANRDPRIGDALSHYFEHWNNLGGDLFMYFNLAGPYGKFGNWGLLEDIRKPTAKMRAITQLVSAPTPPETLGAGIPTTLQAVDASAREGGGVEKADDGSHHLAYLKDGNWLEFLLMVKDPGMYELTVQAGSNNADGRLDLSLSNTPLGTVAIPDTGDYRKWDDTHPAVVQLEAGQLVLRVKVAHAGMDLKSVTFTRRGDIPAGAARAGPLVAGFTSTTETATAPTTAPSAAPATAP
jgi:hypothetical protein